ncbi:MAG: alkyl sulfatase dimerization domain-containing protein [Promethearchaeota archaeon]|jgi:alkyl sulfatase BDS1-like metallo-beta-lactamase superfamily hydrolase
MAKNINENIRDFVGLNPSSSFADGNCYLIPGFGNSCVFETQEGLVIFDTPIRQFANRTFNRVRRYTDKPVKYFIYSHGHFDHAFGYGKFLEEIKEKGWDMPEVIAHENCVRRFEKYQTLDKYHDWINKMQFASIGGRGQNSVVTPYEVLKPTIILKGNDSNHHFKLGNIEFELYHDMGETDDSIWLWVPEKKTICAGDLTISGFPNVGNPYKVQRYPKDWALAMEKMLEKEVEFLVPGHGRLIEGKDNVKNALSITAEAMHFVHDEVVKRLNEGKWFEQIFHEMVQIFPDKFKESKYLREVYGCYRFAIHAAYRLYHGWYDSGNPTDLFPAKSDEIAKEFLKINTMESYLEHAKSLYTAGKLQLSLHILDVIIKGSEKKNNTTISEALDLKIKILKEKTRTETSFIASNIINNSILQIKEKLKEFKNTSKNP